MTSNSYRVTLPEPNGKEAGSLKVGYGQSSTVVPVPPNAKTVTVGVPAGVDGFVLKYREHRQAFRADGTPYRRGESVFKLAASSRGDAAE